MLKEECKELLDVIKDCGLGLDDTQSGFLYIDRYLEDLDVGKNPTCQYTINKVVNIYTPKAFYKALQQCETNLKLKLSSYN